MHNKSIKGGKKTKTLTGQNFNDTKTSRQKHHINCIIFKENFFFLFLMIQEKTKKNIYILNFN